MRQKLKNKLNYHQIIKHYLIEKDLAYKLRNSNKEERRALYAALYDELFLKIPYHPLLVHRSDPDFIKKNNNKLKLLKFFLKKKYLLLEIGAGDCSLAKLLCKYVRKVYAIEISKKIIADLKIPVNFELIISDGIDIPIPNKLINLAFTFQVIEHLHPDDAIEHLENIYRVIVPEGVYICNTPNRLYGPHDISKYFDKTAKGFHLKEYTITELSKLFKLVGFSKVKIIINLKFTLILVPVRFLKPFELILDIIPQPYRKRIIKNTPLRYILGINMAAIK